MIDEDLCHRALQDRDESRVGQLRREVGGTVDGEDLVENAVVLPNKQLLHEIQDADARRREDPWGLGFRVWGLRVEVRVQEFRGFGFRGLPKRRLPSSTTGIGVDVVEAGLGILEELPMRVLARQVMLLCKLADDGLREEDRVHAVFQACGRQMLEILCSELALERHGAFVGICTQSLKSVLSGAKPGSLQLMLQLPIQVRAPATT